MSETNIAVYWPFSAIHAILCINISTCSVCENNHPAMETYYKFVFEPGNQARVPKRRTKPCSHCQHLHIKVRNPFVFDMYGLM